MTNKKRVCYKTWDRAMLITEINRLMRVNEEIRADERAKALDEVRNGLLEKADYMETEEGFYGKVVTEKEIEEVIENLKENHVY